MSQFPNMNQPGSDPYNPFSAPPPGQVPRKSNTWLYILLGVGGGGLLLCCGCVAMSWWGFSAGMGIVSAQLMNQLNADPVAQQHLGTVTSASVDLMASGEEQQRRGEQVLLFNVRGDRGSGQVIAEQAPGQQQQFRNAILRLPDGDEVQLGF
jgi:hypothetical protein